MTLGANMRMWREERGLTLKEVELRTGIDNGNLSRYERDLNFPSIELCIKLADLYSISLDELTGRTDDFGSFIEQSADSYHLSPEERKLIEDYRGLAKPLKELLQDMIRSWQENTRKGNFRSEQ